MPTNRRRRRHERRDYSEADKVFLLTGCVMRDVKIPLDYCEGFFSPLWRDHEAARLAWQELRSELLPDFLRDNDGALPWAEKFFSDNKKPKKVSSKRATRCRV